jgi:hypothetical protein
MKKIVFILIMFCAFTTKAQNLVMNGSFEHNNFLPPNCPTDISNAIYNASVDSSTSITKWSFYGMNNLFYEGCIIGSLPPVLPGFVVPDEVVYDKDFSLVIAARDSMINNWHHYTWNGVTLELSQTLLLGSYYKLSYYQKVITPNVFGTPYGPGALEIGISEHDTSFGVAVDTIAYNDYTWEKIEFVFQATIPAKHLSIKGHPLLGQDAAIVDNFVLTLDSFAVLGVNEQVLEKQLLKITDVLGRESKPTPNVPLFYRYDDGTVEKRIIVE